MRRLRARTDRILALFKSSQGSIQLSYRPIGMDFLSNEKTSPDESRPGELRLLAEEHAQGREGHLQDRRGRQGGLVTALG